MQGSWNHDQAHYRCKLPSEYALANKVDHPPTIYLKESAVVPALDEWIASVFDPANLEATVEALDAAQGPADQDVARAEVAVRKLTDCDERLGKYRAALDAGADATVVAGWMAEVQGEKLKAEQELIRSKPADAYDAEGIRELIEQLGPMEAVPADARYEAKAELYNSLGLELTFDAGQKVVTVEAAPVYSGSCRRGDYPRLHTGDAARRPLNRAQRDSGAG